MKTFMGIPGEPGVVTVMDMDGTRRLEGDFGWGKLDPRRASLALAILTDFLGDKAQAIRYYRRFMWRVMMDWTADQPWTLLQEQVESALKSIKELEPTIGAQKLMAGASLPPVEREGGIGPGGVPFSPIEEKKL